MEHLINIKSLSTDDINKICNRASEFKKGIRRSNHINGHIANMFFENSTRTKLSFEMAENRISANKYNFDANTSSINKGEDIYDTINNLSAIGINAVVLRHESNTLINELKEKTYYNTISFGRIRQYIDRLRTIPVKEPEDGHRGLVYVHRIIRNGMHDQSAGLVHVDELLAQGCEAPDYGCELTDQAEIVGFLVADTPLTQRYMYELMADVLNSASFFGFEQETLEAERQKLVEAMEEIESGTAKMIPWETVKADLEKSIDCRFDEESEDERVLHNQVMEAENAYSRHSRQKELNAIRAMLMAEGEL